MAYKISWQPTTYGVWCSLRNVPNISNSGFLTPVFYEDYWLDTIVDTTKETSIVFREIKLDYENYSVKAIIYKDGSEEGEEYECPAGGNVWYDGDGKIKFSFENKNASNPQLDPEYELRYRVSYDNDDIKNNHTINFNTLTGSPEEPSEKYFVEFSPTNPAYCGIEVTSGQECDAHKCYVVEPEDTLNFKVTIAEHGYISTIKDNGSKYTIRPVFPEIFTVPYTPEGEEERKINEYHNIVFDGYNRYTVTVNNTEAIRPKSAVINGGGSKTFTYSHLGYHIVEWVLDGEGTGVSEQTYTISNIQADHTIDVIEEADTYTITSDDPTFIHPSSVEVEYGGSATFTAGWLGYRVADWLLDGEGTGVSGNQYTVENVTGDHTVGARWEADIYPVSINAVGEGTTWVEGVYIYGVQYPTLHATPAENWKFKGWSYNDTLLSTDRDYTPTGSYPREPLVFDAMFSKTSTIKVTLTAYPDDSCGSVVGGGEYYKGDEVTITAIANKGYRFVRWCTRIMSDVWEEVSTSPTYAFTVSSKRNSIYRAEFEEASDTLPPDRQAVMDAIVRVAVPVRELATMIEDTEKPIDRGLLRKYLASLSSFARKLSEVEENVLNI